MYTLDQILEAKKFTDLFKDGTKKELRLLLKNTHPDLHPNNKEKAEKAFVHVNLIWAKKSEPHASIDDPVKPSTPENTIITKKNEYHLTRKLRNNNGVNIYQATASSGETTLLLATHPKISTMLIEGTKNLKTIKETIPDNYTEFFPETIDAFHVKQEKNKISGVVYNPINNFYSLREVKEDYPEGIPARDIAWMYRRMLVAVGNTHDAGYAHGAPTLDAFLIEPETHALLLVNWQFSTLLGEPIKMVTPETKTQYDADKKTTQKKDLQILTQSAIQLLHKNAPKRFIGFLKGMHRYPTSDARQALGEFDELLKELYGKRTFHSFKMRRK